MLTDPIPSIFIGQWVFLQWGQLICTNFTRMGPCKECKVHSPWIKSFNWPKEAKNSFHAEKHNDKWRLNRGGFKSNQNDVLSSFLESIDFYIISSLVYHAYLYTYRDWDKLNVYHPTTVISWRERTISNIYENPKEILMDIERVLIHQGYNDCT